MRAFSMGSRSEAQNRSESLSADSPRVGLPYRDERLADWRLRDERLVNWPLPDEHSSASRFDKGRRLGDWRLRDGPQINPPVGAKPKTSWHSGAGPRTD